MGIHFTDALNFRGGENAMRLNSKIFTFFFLAIFVVTFAGAALATDCETSGRG